MGNIASIVSAIGQFYIGVIIVYILLSWIPAEGFIGELRGVLGSITEPYLGLFRRIIPPIGMIDISPIVAIFVLEIALNFLVRALAFM